MILVAAVLLVVVFWPDPDPPAGFSDARRALTGCVRAGGGSECYRLGIVEAAVQRGWVPPSYWQIVEGGGYHE